MWVSQTFLTYQKTEENSSRKAKFFKILSQYSFFLIFLVFKLFDWHFDKVKQESINLAYNTGKIVFPEPTLKSFGLDMMNPEKLTPQSSHFKRKSSKNELEIVEAALEVRGICQLCSKKCKETVILPVSVYVYCRPCITDWIRQKGTCPQTNVPVEVDSLIRVFS